jgi:hypothetical protein
VLSDPFRKLRAAFGGQLLGIIQAHNAPFGIENDGGGGHWTEQRPAAGFIQPSDAHPSKLARGTLESRGTQAAHSFAILAWRSGYGRRLRAHS